MKKQAYLFPHPSIVELCESLNELLADNPEWILTNVDIAKHEDGTYTGILDYLEPLEKLRDNKKGFESNQLPSLYGTT
ncbi:TPA: hypothetical protein U0594_001036 [Streptococcus suis]|nr:hypothetical protein [Streptococcus suis]